jgi:putative endonuclease
MSADPRHHLGRRGEELAVQHFERLGYEIVARNHRTRWGELDLVAFDGHTLVFCEVKTRRSATFGSPAEAVTARKQTRIRGLAMQWLRTNGARADVLRFDVADVRPDGRGSWIVDVIEAAF